MQTVTWIDSLYRSGPCLPDLNILLSYVGSFYNDFSARAKRIFNKHQCSFREDRKCCSPASTHRAVFGKDRHSVLLVILSCIRIVPETRDLYFFLSPSAECVGTAEKCGADIGLFIACNCWKLMDITVRPETSYRLGVGGVFTESQNGMLNIEHWDVDSQWDQQYQQPAIQTVVSICLPLNYNSDSSLFFTKHFLKPDQPLRRLYLA